MASLNKLLQVQGEATAVLTDTQNKVATNKELVHGFNASVIELQLRSEMHEVLNGMSVVEVMTTF
jgi:hypothetical protein